MFYITHSYSPSPHVNVFFRFCSIVGLSRNLAILLDLLFLIFKVTFDDKWNTLLESLKNTVNISWVPFKYWIIEVKTWCHDEFNVSNFMYFWKQKCVVCWILVLFESSDCKRVDGSLPWMQWNKIYVVIADSADFWHHVTFYINIAQSHTCLSVRSKFVQLVQFCQVANTVANHQMHLTEESHVLSLTTGSNTFVIPRQWLAGRGSFCWLLVESFPHPRLRAVVFL